MKRLFLLSFIFFFGCGYHLRSTKYPVSLDARKIAIPIIKSPSSQLGFEAEITKMIRRQFISHSKLRIVPEYKADVVLIAKIVEIKREPISYTVREGRYEVTSARWLKVKMEAMLIDRRKGKVIWKATFREKAPYSVDPHADPMFTRSNEMRALRYIGEQIAQRIYLRTMERF